MSDSDTVILSIGIAGIIFGLIGMMLPGDYGAYGKLQIGNLADRPITAIQDQWYYANDTQELFYWNGSSWFEAPLGGAISDYDIYGKLLTGLNSTMPSAGINDRWFYSNDTNQLWYDWANEWHFIDFFNSTTDDLAHRKWSWADEQGWSKTFHLPLSFTAGNWTILNNGNPVFERNMSGWDLQLVCVPEVAHYNGTYYMAYQTKANDGKDKIGFATSTNKINWTRSQTPIIESGTGATGAKSWHSGRCQFPDLIIDLQDQKFKIWWQGKNASNSGSVGYAYCNLADDPLDSNNWVEWEFNPCNDFTYSEINPMGTLKLGLAYYQLRLGTGGFYLFLSNNGTGWIKYSNTAVLGLGSSGEWDDYNLAYGSLFWNLGNFYLLYSGRGGSSDVYRIGIAMSGTDGTSYERLWNNTANPVHQHNYATWHCASPSMIMEDKSFYMWYFSNSPYAIYLAKLDLDY